MCLIIKAALQYCMSPIKQRLLCDELQWKWPINGTIGFIGGIDPMDFPV